MSSTHRELQPYAVRSEESRGRCFAEPEHPYRDPFERDRDRVLLDGLVRLLAADAVAHRGHGLVGGGELQERRAAIGDMAGLDRGGLGGDDAAVELLREVEKLHLHTQRSGGGWINLWAAQGAPC